jgi:hypothetical protein
MSGCNGGGDTSSVVPKHTTPSCDKGKLDDVNGEDGYDRLAILLPFATSEILVFPPVRGSRVNFERCITYLKEKDVFVSLDTAILFAPPFFALNGDTANTDIPANKELFCHFLALKESHPNMHILTQRTITNRVIGECISDKDNKYPIATLLEATYVLYPYKRVLSEKGGMPDVEVGGITFSAAAANEVSLPASTNEELSVSPTKYVKGTKGTLSGSVAFPPKTDKLGPKIYEKVDPRTYRYYGGGATVLDANKVQRFLLRAPIDRGTDFIADDASTDMFIESQTDLHVNDVPIVRVPLGARTYFFRSPGDAVMNNWLHGRFTRSEAGFLNDLNLRKSMLAKIFEGEPNPYQILANFLKNAVNGRCFTDERMLTWSECQASREFVSRVFQYFMLNDARIARLDEEERDEEREVVQSQLDSLTGLQQVLHHNLEQQQGVVKEAADTALEGGIDLRFSKVDMDRNLLNHKMLSVAGQALGGNSHVTTGGGRVTQQAITQLITPLGMSEGQQGGGDDAAYQHGGFQFGSKRVLYDMYEENKYMIEVLVIEKKTEKYWKGMVSFRAGPDEIPSTHAEQIVSALNEEYPGYSIIF